MSNFEDKLGLSYISERDSSFRYADINKQEKWLLPLSEYTPLCEIKRGQLCSIATPDDIRKFAVGYVEAHFPEAEHEAKITEIYDQLMNFKETFVVLTDVSVHDHAVGIAREYSEGYRYSDSGIIPRHIHVIQSGQVLYDPAYNNTTGLSLDSTVKTTNEDNESVNLDYNCETASTYEYLPEFLNNYNENIGKTVYAKGGEPGNLTIIPEEGYLSHRNIIKVGIIADANNNLENNAADYFGAIEVLLEGDQRGVIDSTQLELILAEDIKILKDDPARVFAVGHDLDAPFKFRFGLSFRNQFDTTNQFISLRRLDGKSYTIFLGSNENPVVTDTEDLAYLRYNQNQARLHGQNINTVINIETGTVHTTTPNVCVKLDIDSIDETNLQSSWTSIKAALNEAIKYIGVKPEGSDYEDIQSLVTSHDYSDQNSVGATFTADKVGGYFELYISKDLQNSFESYVYNHGSYDNRGKAILADIRVESRCRTIAGVYNSGNYDQELKAGDKAIFLKLGVFNSSDTPYNFNAGSAYYLSDHGKISKTIMEYQGRVCKVGTAENDNRLLVDLRDPIKILSGHEALGLVRPTADGNANHGYFVMDGQTPHSKEEFSVLYNHLRGYYSEATLTYSEDPDYFVIPKTTITTPEGEDGAYCQIRYIPDTFEHIKSAHEPYSITQGVLTDTSEVVDFDISELVLYGTGENKLYVDNLEQYDIKLYVDVRDGVTETEEKEWTLIPEGFHTYNNTLYYGYKWTINKTEPADADNLFGTWKLQCQIDGSRQHKDDTTEYPLQPHGLMYERDPFQRPISLAGHYYKLYVARRNLWQGEFNLGRIIEHMESRIKYGLKAFEAEHTIEDFKVKGLAEVDATNIDIKINKNSPNKFKLRLVSDNGVESSIPVIIDENGNLGLQDRVDDYIAVSSDNNFAVNKEVRNNKQEVDSRLNEIDDKLVAVEAAVEANKVNELKTILEDNIDGNRVNLGYEETDRNIQLFNNFEIYQKDNSDPLENIVNYQIRKNQYTLINEILPAENVEKTQVFTHFNTPSPFYTLVENSINGFYFKIKKEGEEVSGADIKAASFIQQSSAKVKTILKEIWSAAENADNNGFDKNENFRYESDLTREQEQEQTPVIEEPIQEEPVLEDTPTEETQEPIETPQEETEAISIAGLTDEPQPQRIDFNGKEDLANSITDNALQMFYELPTAVYRYNNMAVDNKRNFGFIIERVLEKINKFIDVEDYNNIEYNRTIDKQSTANIDADKVGFRYTKDEAQSIVAYLDMLLSNEDDSVNISSTVGMLSKAAGEAQRRLLSLETSVFGYDADTIPGVREIDGAEQHGLIENTSTYFGLNRLVKYLSREIFGSDDPDVVFMLGHKDDDNSVWTSDISRLDYFDQEINGHDAVPADDSYPVRTPLKTSLGKTYFNLNTLDATAEDLKDNFHADEVFFDTDDAKVIASENEGKPFYDARLVDKIQEPIVTEVTVEDTDVDKLGFIKSSVTSMNNYVGEEFDGLNEAVNRIANKLNNTTAMLTDFDTANTKPAALDRIRQNITTIIDDIYNEVYEDNFEPNMESHPEPFIKSKESRIDVSQHKLFDYNKAIESPTAPDETNITLKEKVRRDKAGEVTDLALVNSYSQDSSATANASLLDIIADQLNGEGQLLRADETNGPITETSSFSDAYKYRLSETIFDRLNKIERFLDRIEQFTNNYKHFEKDPLITAEPTTVKQSTLLEPTKLDNLLNIIDGYLGIDFNSNTASHRDENFEVVDDKIEFDEKLNTAQVLVQGDSVKTPEAKEGLNKTTFEQALYLRKYLHFAVEDIAARLKIREYEDRSLDLGLGEDYLSATWNNTIDPANYRSRILSNETEDEAFKTGIASEAEISNTLTKHNGEENYTLTSDMQAILRLLHGATREQDPLENFNTVYDHFATGEEYSVHNDTITKLYDDLYRLPKRYSPVLNDTDPHSNYLDEHTVSFINAYDTKSAGTLYDITEKDTTSYSDYEACTPLSNKNIDVATGDTQLNRFDIIEQEIIKMQNLIGQSLLDKFDRVSGKLTTKVTVGDGENDLETVEGSFKSTEGDLTSNLDDNNIQWNNVLDLAEDVVAPNTAHNDLEREKIHDSNFAQTALNNFKLSTNYAKFEDINDLFDDIDKIYDDIFIKTDDTDIIQHRFIKTFDPNESRYEYAAELSQPTNSKDTEYENKIISIDLESSYDPEHTYAYLESVIQNYKKLGGYKYWQLEGKKNNG